MPDRAVVGARAGVDLRVGVLDERGERSSAAAEPSGRPGSNAATAISRRDLAGLGAAHAVGDREQRRADEVGVLVALPLAAGVGAFDVLGDAQHQRCDMSGELGVADADAIAVVQGLRTASAAPR